MAGSIAYAALISLLPLLLLLLVVVSAVGDAGLSEQVHALLERFLTASGNEFLYAVLANATNRTSASLIGAASLLWGSSRIFRGMETAFTELYEASERSTVRNTVRNTVVVFAALSLATILSAASAVYLARFTAGPVALVVESAALVVGLVVAFFPLYYVFPQRDLTVAEVLPGTVFAALGWTLLQMVFSLYVAQVNSFAAYGTLSGVILLLLWLYGGSFVLLVGASLNVVLTDSAGRR